MRTHGASVGYYVEYEVAKGKVPFVLARVERNDGRGRKNIVQTQTDIHLKVSNPEKSISREI